MRQLPSLLGGRCTNTEEGLRKCKALCVGLLLVEPIFTTTNGWTAMTTAVAKKKLKQKENDTQRQKPNIFAHLEVEALN